MPNNVRSTLRTSPRKTYSKGKNAEIFVSGKESRSGSPETYTRTSRSGSKGLTQHGTKRSSFAKRRDFSDRQGTPRTRPETYYSTSRNGVAGVTQPIGKRPSFHGEFDPGSGRTLAACLTHASRTELFISVDSLVANG